MSDDDRQEVQGLGSETLLGMSAQILDSPTATIPKHAGHPSSPCREHSKAWHISQPPGWYRPCCALSPRAPSLPATPPLAVSRRRNSRITWAEAGLLGATLLLHF